MPKFRLATLERLRTTALEERGQELYAAGVALAAGRATLAAAQEELRTSRPPATADPDAIIRAAAHRDRMREEVFAAVQEVQRLEQDVADARQAWLDARAQLKAVTVLHDRHREHVRAEALRREQAELDDLVTIRHARTGGHP